MNTDINLDTKRQLRIAELLTLVSTAIALSITFLLVTTSQAQEGNLIAALGFETIGWYGTAAIGLGGSALAFVVFRAVHDDRYDWFNDVDATKRLSVATTGGWLLATLSTMLAMNDVLVLAVAGIPDSFYVGEVSTFLVAVVIVTAALIRRPVAVDRCVPRPSGEQARAIGFALAITLSVVAIPFAGGMAQAAPNTPQPDLDSAPAMSLQTSGDNATVYVGSNDNSLHAVDAGSGEKRWEFSTGSSVFSSPTVVDGTVYVGSSDNNLYAINASSGDKRWNFSTGNSIFESSPTVVGDTVFIGSTDNNLYAINRSTGAEKWSYSTGGSVSSSPTVDNGTVYFGSGDNTLYALNADTGTEKWTYTAGGNLQKSSPTISEGTIYVGAEDNNLYAIDADTGTEQWNYSTGDIISASAPTVANGTVYIGSNDDSLHAVDADTGNQEWTYATGLNIRSSPTVANGTVFVGSNDDNLYALDASTGNEEWSYTAAGNIDSSPTVFDGIVYVGSSDGNLYAIDVSSGTEQWAYTTGGDITKTSPTIVSADGTRSEGSRVLHETLGHHGGLVSASGETISGTAVDQNGNPIPNATVVSHSITEPALDTSDARSLERQAADLRDELTNPLPESWDPDYDLESHYNDADNNYLLVHEGDDWGTTNQLRFDPRSPLGAPSLQTTPDDSVVLTLWDPSQGGGLGQNQIDGSYPGSTTSGTIIVEQIGPTGETIDKQTHETSTIANVGGVGPLTDGTEIPGVTTRLPTGVYRAYPKGDRASGYTFIRGSPTELADSWESDLRNEAGQLTQRADRIRNLLSQDHVTRSTVRTDSNGQFTVEVPSNAVKTDLKTMKADGQILQDIENPTIGDLRDVQANDYNGSFYLPNPGANTVEPPASNVTVTAYRSPQVPMGNMESFADLQAWLQEQRLNETVSELRSEYDQQPSEMERSNLERIYSDHRTLVETVPGAEDRYLDRSDFDELQDAEDLTNDELTTETRHMQIALSGAGQIEPPDLTEEDVVEIIENRDDLQITPDPENVTDADGYIEVEYPLPDGVNPDTIAPELHWSNGSVQSIDDQYWEVQSNGMFGGDTLVVSGIPIDDTDPAAFDIRVQAASTDDSLVGGGENDGLLDDRLSGLNPAAAGAMPAIDAVDFSTLSPGPSERVYVGIDAAEDAGYDRIIAAEAWNDDGESINATVDEAGNRVNFQTDGTGTHTVRLIYENQQGDRFTLTERIDAKQQSRSDPATVRASGDPDSMVGLYAVTGDNLEGARLESNGGTLSVDVIAEDSDGPGELNIQPANAMDGTEHTIDINVLHGSDEQRVGGNIPVNIHLENTEATTLYWRSSAGVGGDPITHGGGTRYGSVEKPNDEKHVVHTYTEPDGSVTVTTIESAGPWQRSTHWMARMIGGIPFVGGLFSPSGGAAGAGLLGIGGFAIKRRRSGA